MASGTNVPHCLPPPQSSYHPPALSRTRRVPTGQRRRSPGPPGARCQYCPLPHHGGEPRARSPSSPAPFWGLGEPFEVAQVLAEGGIAVRAPPSLRLPWLKKAFSSPPWLRRPGASGRRARASGSSPHRGAVKSPPPSPRLAPRGSSCFFPAASALLPAPPHPAPPRRRLPHQHIQIFCLAERPHLPTPPSPPSSHHSSGHA